MRNKKTRIDSVTIISASNRARMYCDDLIQRAKQVEQDQDRATRLNDHWCKSCFYVIGRIGGAAMTNRECSICGADQVYSSTFTDALCNGCAQKNGLCKHCGGDIDMRERRKPYPFQENTNE